MTVAADEHNICVFCGSRMGTLDDYKHGAEALAEAMVSRDIGLVYGGGSNGLMGVIATAVIERGGRAIGVIPRALQKRELAHDGLDRLLIVDSMHERKAEMAQLSDAFIAMPGGFGTLEELFEAVTWNQLGFQRKPAAVLNVGGFYDRLIEFIHYQSTQGFIDRAQLGLVQVESDPGRLVDSLMHAVRAGS